MSHSKFLFSDWAVKNEQSSSDFETFYGEILKCYLLYRSSNWNKNNIYRYNDEIIQ